MLHYSEHISNLPQPERGPAYSWRSGHQKKARVAMALSKYNIPSVIGVQVDSFLIEAVFGQCTSKHFRRHHSIKSLSVTAPEIDNFTRKDLSSKFQELKKNLAFDKNPYAYDYLKTVEESCPLFLGSFPDFGDAEVVRQALSWFVQYASAIALG